MLLAKFGETYQLAFANVDGDNQNINSIPEVPICEGLGTGLIDGLGEKIHSSSLFLGK